MAEPISRNAYAILGVAPDCDDSVIVTAYRRLARRYHPDRAGDSGTPWMIRLNAAFDRLRTPERRLEYDLELERAGIRLPPRATRRHSGRPGDPARSSAAGHSPASRWRPERDGTGGAGPPPGRPSGTVLDFGRHIGWSIAEIARVDPGYLAWLEDHREGKPFLEEIDRTLRGTGYRSSSAPAERGRGRRRRS